MGAKTEQLQIRVTPRQKAALKRAARRAGQSVSEYVLARVLPSGRDRLEELVGALSDERQRRYALAEINALLAGLEPVELAEAIATRPPGDLTPYMQNYLAAMIEQRRSSWSELGPDLQLLLRVMSTFAADDYLDAQQLRAGLRRDTAALLREVDVLAMPTCARTAPAVSDTDVLESMADTIELDAACRYIFLGNLTGLPAASAPVGRDARGMPIGLQILGDAWDEATVLQVCAHLERTGIASVPRPEVRADVLRAKA